MTKLELISRVKKIPEISSFLQGKGLKKISAEDMHVQLSKMVCSVLFSI